MPFSLQVAAAKQLEESKTKIENLLDWLSHADKESERAGIKQKQVTEQNGIHFPEGDSKPEMGEEDEFNGNLLETDVDGLVGTTEENLNQQYQKVKVCCLQHNDVVKFYCQVYKKSIKDRNNLAHVTCMGCCLIFHMEETEAQGN